ncbi:NADH-quinone oxidoreductase subunit N [Cerasicoccus arenae]|uniref:NADH-quinone oxidoreductase subunit N n=1 Tax=Cerasicoccus arenae TaxID=424488 RepID=A0A8J3DES2_9BACT|nr:NADH-quinone oxidoreductase subunit N [Cerasicoccus arenae]MBK1856635.1 NADH-quinone oxidoreductase subunit N [Cerasicoccus arenae]GHC12319.1 NADH-quinone oxidoreductase subunit N [Cerasicoccus arenae]
MNYNGFQELAATNQWSAIWPELSMAGIGLLVLCLDLFLPSSRKRLIPLVAIFGQLALLAVLVMGCGCATESTGPLFGGMIESGPYTPYMRAFFVLSSTLVCYLGVSYLSRQNLPRSEFYLLTIFVSGAMMLLVQSSNFVMLFVSLETVTIGFYVLVSYCRYSPFSLEAGLKYLILGALSSAILLFGIVLLYGAASNPALAQSTTDSMNFAALGKFIAATPEEPLVLVGAVLVLCGICFKIGAVPFQIWVPDVYQGAPTPVTAFLAVSSKAAGFLVLMNLVAGPFAALSKLTVPLLSAIAIITILFGNITALGQRNVKRVIGLSGIAHAGYLLVGVVAMAVGVALAPWAIIFYLFAYLFASFAVFGVMVHLAGVEDEIQEIDHYQKLAERQPFLAGVLAIGLGSLAGIPPLAGFIGKLLLFIAAFQAELYTLLGAAIIGVVISVYYYFGWMREAFFIKPALPGDEARPSYPMPGAVGIIHKLTLGLLVVITVLMGLFQRGIFGG